MLVDFRPERVFWQPGLLALANTHRASAALGMSFQPERAGPTDSCAGAEMPSDRNKPVAELQWLEDGVNAIVTHTFRCTKVIVLGLFELYRQWRG
jgi:hypothetical protein